MLNSSEVKEEMNICALGSGSSGNSYYIENNKKAILVDAGFSAKQISEKLASIGKSAESIKGIFITHEHIDHVRGVDVLARQLNIPVFATKLTSENCFLCSDDSLINNIKNDEAINLAGLKIQAFAKSHDASDPVSYSISNGKKISIITDLGKVSQDVIDSVSSSNFLFFESNHDEEMLSNGPYPYFLKARIRGEQGHLSNRKASLCILEHATKKLKTLVLSHLSKVNNTPELALKTFKSMLKERSDLNTRICVSMRDEPTELFRL